VLEGLLITYLNIDEVIAIIREEDEPKSALMARFNLSERQAEAILEIKLRHLAKLEEIKLRTELDELAQERDRLISILNDPSKLRALVKEEIIHDRDTYGDKRKSPIVERQDAQALKEEDIIPNEPLTVVLSEQGWVRAAKGYDIDGRELSFKSGDNFRAQTNARSNQPVIFFDNFGQVYSVPGHTLPSARGQGEPLTGKLNPPEKGQFVALISGSPEDWVLLSNDAGYGFITQLKELFVKQRSGKSCLKLPKNSLMLPPRIILSRENAQIACATSAGRLLIFPVNALPELSKGKGNKIINIPTIKASAREEYVIDVQILMPENVLSVHAGRRHFTLKSADLQHYQGERGRRGNALPRGLQNVTALAVEKASG